MTAVLQIEDKAATFDGSMGGLVEAATRLGAVAGNIVRCDFGKGPRSYRLYKTASGLWATQVNLPTMWRHSGLSVS